MAGAVGLYGVRVERPCHLDDALRAGFAHPSLRRPGAPPGAALPTSLTFRPAKGFTLWATWGVLDGDGSTVLAVARTDLRQLALQ